MSSPDLDREKFDYFKQRDQETRAMVWKYEYTRLMITVIALVVLIMIMWKFLLVVKSDKPDTEDFAPYASILAHDTYRSDPAFDYSKPEVRLAVDSVTH